MKLFLAYALIVIGVPYFIGLLLGQLLTLPVAVIVGLLRKQGILGGADSGSAARDIVGGQKWSRRGSVQISVSDRIVHICMDVCNGFGAVLMAGVIFHMFGFRPSIGVLLIPVAWEILLTVFSVLHGMLWV